MKFCPDCGGMMLPIDGSLKCYTCGYETINEEDLEKEYVIEKEYNTESDNTNETVSYSIHNMDYSDHSLEKHPYCNERRKKEYKKGMRRNEYYINTDTTDIFYGYID